MKVGRVLQLLFHLLSSQEGIETGVEHRQPYRYQTLKSVGKHGALTTFTTFTMAVPADHVGDSRLRFCCP